MSDKNDKFATQSWPLQRFDFPMPIRYHLTPAEGPGVVICLHGFQDHALSMLRRIGWWEAPLPFQILAINGPFPVPVWTPDGFREAYSWYFRDTTRDLEFVPPATTAERLQLLIRNLGLDETPKVLFGFSMGGVLSPYVAQQMRHVRGIIGLGCGYAPEIYAQCPPLQLYAVHGDQDDRFPIASARAEFQQALGQRHRGEFFPQAGLIHRVETHQEPLVRSLALKCFSEVMT